jgi:hypothetical protein
MSTEFFLPFIESVVPIAKECLVSQNESTRSSLELIQEKILTLQEMKDIKQGLLDLQLYRQCKCLELLLFPFDSSVRTASIKTCSILWTQDCCINQKYGQVSVAIYYAYITYV